MDAPPPGGGRVSPRPRPHHTVRSAGTWPGRVSCLRRLKSALCVAGRSLAALARADLPERERTDFHCYLDEFQNFLHAEDFAEILAERDLIGPVRTAAFATGQIAGPLLVTHTAGPGGDLSRPLLIACVLLMLSAGGLCPRRHVGDTAVNVPTR